jgi:hypothetical protein
LHTTLQKFYVRSILKLKQYTHAQGALAGFEASTHLVRGSSYKTLPLFAGQVREFFPWAKVLVSVREPISRAISMLVHINDKYMKRACLGRKSLAWCLLHHSQISRTTCTPAVTTVYLVMCTCLRYAV